MSDKLHRSLFVREVKEIFPSLADEVNDQDGLLTMEVSVLCDYAQRNINSKDKAELKKCFDLALKYYREGNQDMVNAIGLSFARDLNFSDTKKNQRS
ncbi:DUF7674 family protein [Aliikangiella sp. IMCC44653]